MPSNLPVGTASFAFVGNDAKMTTNTLAHAGANVVVAGATGGLGSQFVAQLQQAGAHVTAIGRNTERLQALADTGVQALALDLRLPEASQAAVAKAAERGPIDLLVNAVGVVAFGPTVELSTDAMEELFLTNTFVPIMLSRAALAHMAPGSTMVNISGVIAEKNLPGMAAYGASKAALRSFQEAFAREARRKKVTVLDTRPPHTETGLAERAIEGEAPSFGTGLTPGAVVATILAAVARGERDLPSTAFAQDA